MISRSDIQREARALLGVPFRHQGLDPETGIDCRGHLLCMAQGLGYTVLRDYRNNYRRRPDADEFRAALESELEVIDIADAREGDVLFIRWPREKKPTHVGVICAGRYETMIVHARGNGHGVGQVIEEPLKRWQRYVEGAFKFPNVID